MRCIACHISRVEEDKQQKVDGVHPAREADAEWSVDFIVYLARILLNYDEDVGSQRAMKGGEESQIVVSPGFSYLVEGASSSALLSFAVLFSRKDEVVPAVEATLDRSASESLRKTKRAAKLRDVFAGAAHTGSDSDVSSLWSLFNLRDMMVTSHKSSLQASLRCTGDDCRGACSGFPVLGSLKMWNNEPRSPYAPHAPFVPIFVACGPTKAWGKGSADRLLKKA